MLLPLLSLRGCHVSRIVEGEQDHDDGNCKGGSCTAGKYPSYSFDFGSGVRVEGDCDFVIEFLNLRCSVSIATVHHGA